MNNLWLFHDFTIFNMLLRRTLRTINLSGSDDLGIEACELQSLCEYFSSFRLSVSITISFYLFLLSIFSLSLSPSPTHSLPIFQAHTRTPDSNQPNRFAWLTNWKFSAPFTTTHFTAYHRVRLSTVVRVHYMTFLLFVIDKAWYLNGERGRYIVIPI